MSYDTGLSMEERVSSLFQPDTLLPDQYLDTYRRKVHLEPEKKLMLAILEDAHRVFSKVCSPPRTPKVKALFHEAEDWIQQAAGDGVFAFDSICEALGFKSRLYQAGASDLEGKFAWRNAAKPKFIGSRRGRENTSAEWRFHVGPDRRLRRAASR